MYNIKEVMAYTQTFCKSQWWDKSIEEINNLIPLLTNSNLEYVKEQLKKLL